MGRKRYADAAAEAKRFLERYPNSVLRGRMESLKKDIDEELLSRQPASVTGGKGGTL
jgi:hypothetical protein